MEQQKNVSGKPPIYIVNIGSPKPFGLTLGKSEKNETNLAIQKEGGEILADRRLRPATSVFDVKGLQIEHLLLSQFWFYTNILFGISYRFQTSLVKKVFYTTLEKLKKEYGCPIKYVKPLNGEAGLALWKFGELEIECNVPSVSEHMCLEYRSLPLFLAAAQEEASYSDEGKTVMEKEQGL